MGATRPTFTIVTATRCLFRHQLARTRQLWWSVIVAGLAQPTLFLLAMGAGIGSQIDESALARLDTDSYLAWIGPGILAVSAMEIGAREASWPTMGLLKWGGAYRAILRTPIQPGQLGVAHVAWIGFRALFTSVLFLSVLTLAGVAESWWALAVPAVAGLTAIVHAAPLVALTAAIDTDNLYPAIHRVIVFPLFIFSGSFFPVQDMPAAVASFARITPSWHGVQAARDLTQGRVNDGTAGHLGLLVVLCVLTTAFARWSFIRNVEP